MGFRWMALLMGILLPCLTACLTVSLGWAYGLTGFAPREYPAPREYGEGVYFAPYVTPIYATPNGDVVEELHWAQKSETTSVFSQSRGQSVPGENAFLAYYPALNVAMMAVVGENGDGWAEVVYDQARHKTGWVPLQHPHSVENKLENKPDDTPDQPAHFGQFQPWQEFMKYNAKASGFYWLTGVSAYHRAMRSSPEDTAKLVPVNIARKMFVRHVRGNWMLVEALDMENNAPMGWIRWRDDKGQLMVFVNFSKEQQPLVFPSF